MSVICWIADRASKLSSNRSLSCKPVEAGRRTQRIFTVETVYTLGRSTVRGR